MLFTARHPARRSAFTLVETLVVIAVIGLLAALLLPAIQAARERGRRTHCTNNLHQIGAGLHAFHGAHRAFPQGAIETRTATAPQARQLAWSALLLPFVEEQAIFDKLDLSKAYDSPENAPAATKGIPTFICPSIRRESQLVGGLGASDYGGMQGERLNVPGRPASQRPNNPEKGTLINKQPISLRMITDGSAETLIVAENVDSPDGQWINGHNIFDQGWAIHRTDVPWEDEIRSLHTGGANGLFADGSVRFLPEELDLAVLAAICTRAFGETVSNWEDR